MAETAPLTICQRPDGTWPLPPADWAGRITWTFARGGLEGPPTLLEVVDRWPLPLRQRWAARALEIRATRGCSLEEAELIAARELGAGGDA